MLKDCHGNRAGPGQLAGVESGRAIGLASHQVRDGLGNRGHVGRGGGLISPHMMGCVLSEETAVTLLGGPRWGWTSGETNLPLPPTHGGCRGLGVALTGIL